MAALETRLGESLSDEGARWAAPRDAITAILKPWFAARKVDDLRERCSTRPA